MYFDVKDILLLENIRFKNGLIDTSIYGHPVLVIKKDEDYFYYLTMTSVPKSIDNKEYFLIQKSKTNKLRKPSYVNLKYIYKSEIKNYIPKGYINDELFKNIINALNDYQSNFNSDKEYAMIKKKLPSK